MGRLMVTFFTLFGFSTDDGSEFSHATTANAAASRTKSFYNIVVFFVLMV